MALGLIWKPKGLGSQEALGLLKKELQLSGKGRTGLGHTGILDPFAQGWLLCGVGEATKILSLFMGLDKVYEATMCLGLSSDTLDDTGQMREATGLNREKVLKWLSQSDEVIESQLIQYLNQVSGTSFDQVPPHFSAVHVDGKRSYEWARQGVEKTLKSKSVTLYEARHLNIKRDDQGRVHWNFAVKVSAGTYIRAFARDWSLDICGYEGHLTRLVRQAVGPFGENDLNQLALSPNKEEAPFWKQLPKSEFEDFFDFHQLNETEALKVRNNGDWKPIPWPKARLLMGPDSMGAVAWTLPESGKLARVFNENPF